ncbi:MAG: RNA 3'-terminal phosphate cyclase [Promethearchaeota archaeon]
MKQDILQIDGSEGEGGGQIIRTSIALSALTGHPVRLFNIRANRSNPGLRASHVITVKSVAELAQAEVSQLKVGSKTFDFYPNKPRGGEYKFDIGTAGSISLVLQGLLPVALLAPEPTSLKITGGTDVNWSPLIDYVKHVKFKILQKMGIPLPQIHVKQRGHYPKGGGQVEIKITPVDSFSPLKLIDFGEILSINGISHCVRLPSHIAQRQASAAYQYLVNQGYNPSPIKEETYPQEHDPHLGAGTGIVLWAESAHSVLGADALGERGKKAEKVGQEAAQALVTALKTGYALDLHMGDMIIPYLALAKGSSEVSVAKITQHQLTNIALTERFFTNVKFEIKGELGSKGIISRK